MRSTRFLTCHRLALLFVSGLTGHLGAATLIAQAVTLPTIRVTGPSAEKRLLIRSIAGGRALYDTSSTDRGTRTKAIELHRALDRLSLAAISARELSQLRRATSADDSARVLSGVRRGQEDQGKRHESVRGFHVTSLRTRCHRRCR